MDADERGESLTTPLVTFRGKFPFVNVAAPQGELRVELLDPDGHVILPFSVEACAPIRTNSTRQRVHWGGADDLSVLAGKPVRFRFHLKSGQLYSFWVSTKESGESGPKDVVE